MCELFAVSSLIPISPLVELDRFKGFAQNNPDGWGIGYFEDGRPQVHKKAEPASKSAEYSVAADAARSRIVIAHLRNASNRNTVSNRNAHPFILNFLERSWIFAHNGTMSVEHKSLGDRIDATVDSARLFEFLSDQISDWYSTKSLRSLFGAVRSATEKSYREFRGTANFILTDGEFLFVNKDGMHDNQIYVKRIRDSIQFCTEQLGDGWFRTWRPSGFRGRLMLAARGRLVHSQRIAV